MGLSPLFLCLFPPRKALETVLGDQKDLNHEITKKGERIEIENKVQKEEQWR